MPGLVRKAINLRLDGRAVARSDALDLSGKQGRTVEIFPDDAKAGGAKVVSTGRSDFPNQINNVLAFPGIFRGAFDVRASDINDEMKIAAAKAIASFVTDDLLSADYIIPSALDKNVATAVAEAVAKVAKETGVARI